MKISLKQLIFCLAIVAMPQKQTFADVSSSTVALAGAGALGTSIFFHYMQYQALCKKDVNLKEKLSFHAFLLKAFKQKHTGNFEPSLADISAVLGEVLLLSAGTKYLFEKNAALKAAKKAAADKIVADKKAKEENDKKAREELEKKTREENDKKTREENDKKTREELEKKTREELEKKTREELEKKTREDAAKAEKKASDDAAKKVLADAEKARLAREAADKKALDDAAKVRLQNLAQQLKAQQEVINAATQAARDESSGSDSGSSVDPVDSDDDLFN